MSSQASSDTVDFSKFDFESIQYGDLYKTKAGPSGFLPKADRAYNNTSQSTGIMSSILTIAPFTSSEDKDWNVGFNIPDDKNNDFCKTLKEKFGDDVFDICQEFYQKFGIDITEHIVEKAVENSESWFNESLDEDVLKDMITPFIRPETVKSDVTYPPTFSARLNNSYLQKVKFFDADKKIINNPNYDEIFEIGNVVKVIFTYGNIDIDKGKASFKPHCYIQCIQFLMKGENVKSEPASVDDFDKSKIGFKLPIQKYETGNSTKIMYGKSILNFEMKDIKFLPFTFESQFPGSPKINYQIHGRLPSGSFERNFAEAIDDATISFLTKNSKDIFGKVKKGPIIKRKVSPVCKFGKDKEQDPFMRFNVLKHKNSDNFNLKVKNRTNDTQITGNDDIIAALTDEDGKLISNKSYDIEGYCMHVWIKPSGEISTKFIINSITIKESSNNNTSENATYTFGESETIDNGDNNGDEEDDDEEEEIPDSDED